MFVVRIPGVTTKKNLRSAEEARRKTPSFEYLTDRGLTEGWLSPYEPEDTRSKLVGGIHFNSEGGQSPFLGSFTEAAGGRLTRPLNHLFVKHGL